MISIRTMISESKNGRCYGRLKATPSHCSAQHARVVLNSSSQFAFAASPKKLRVQHGGGRALLAA